MTIGRLYNLGSYEHVRYELTAEEFRRRNGHFEGTPEEYVQRCKEMHGQNVAERNAWEERSAKARKMMDDLGGAAKWRDAKLDWEDYSDTE